MEAPAAMSAAFRRLLAQLVERQASRAAALVALSVLSSLAAGLGVALLLPMLPLLGLGGEARDGALVEAFRLLGLQPALGTILLLFAAVSALQAVAQRTQAVEGARLAETFSRDFQGRLFRALQEARWDALLGSRGSEVLHAATVELRRATVAVRLLPNLFGLGLLALAYLAMAAWVSPIPTLAAAGAAGVLLVLLRGRAGLVYRTGSQLAVLWRAQTGDLDDYLEGFKIARCYGVAERHRQRLEQAAGEVAALQVRTLAQVTAGQLWFRIGALAFLSAFLYGSVRFLAAPASELLVLLYVFSRVVPVASQLEQQVAQVAADLPALAALEALAGRLESVREEIPATPGLPLPLRHSLVLDGVDYFYPEGGGRGVHGVSLEIPAGSLVALVGPSGAGKSTVIDLVLGLLQPARGQIRVDGAPLAADRLEDWRATLGYVTQDSWLFHDTIRANLGWTAPEADEAALWRALEQAGAGFVRGLPEGLDTIVGDRGGMLSGGERQRLALARAFLRQPSLLVLDEPTSSLDAEAEARLMDLLESQRGLVTILLVTHRPGCASRADRVYRLEEGRLVAPAPPCPAAG